jgi:neopullulanase
MMIQTPDWVKHAVFYQIFPDRFARSKRTPHPKGLRLQPWGTPPDKQGFQGGDLHGVVERLDHLSNLGINAIYFNPIFFASHNHRYNTYDYFKVDPLLGGDEALRELLDVAHARGIKVILDGVFNHTGRGFWAFHHILENREKSPFLDWFTVHGWPLRAYSHSKEHPINYAAWWEVPSLPKLNTQNQAVRDYIMQIARYWLDFGIDGWRLDVPNEIDDDGFWREFRETVKSANPEAYICGEIWGEAKRWLQGDQFDAVMNYLFMNATLSFFGARSLKTENGHPELPLEPLNSTSFGSRIDHMLNLYPPEITQAMFNLIDSHDTARALWILGEDKSALRLSVLFQMTMPGAPCVYYGDEVGLSSAGDPHCREAFPWDQKERWDHDLLEHYRQAIHLRQEFSVFRTGSFQALSTPEGSYAFQRSLEEQLGLVIFNVTTKPLDLDLQFPDLPHTTFDQLWPERREHFASVADGLLKVQCPPRESLILLASSTH